MPVAVAGVPLVAVAVAWKLVYEEEGLLNQCTNLRRLNLRGCKEVGNAGVLAIARRCPNLRELCLSGLTSVSAEAVAEVIVQCKRLARFKAELWFDIPAGQTVAFDPMFRSFRRLTDSDAARFGPRRIEVATVRQGDTSESLAGRMAGVIGAPATPRTRATAAAGPPLWWKMRTSNDY